MLPAYPRPHNHSPPQPFFLTDVDQWFNIRLPASLSSINYRHQIGTHYFLRRNPQPACDPVFPWTRQTRQRLRPSLPCHPPGRSELRQGVSTNETHCQRRHRDGGREEEEVASVPAAEPADVAALLVHSSAICRKKTRRGRRPA